MKQAGDCIVELTTAVPSDAARLSRIARAAKAHWGYPDNWLQQWAAELAITAEFLEQHWVCVARAGDTPLGFVAIDHACAPPEIVHLWILPGHQRSGIGRRLVQAAIAEARRQEIKTLAVESDPNAETFYLACGATRVGAVPAPMPGAPDRFLPRLRLDVS